MAENTIHLQNINDLKESDFSTIDHGELFRAQVAPIGKMVGAQKMGCRVVVVEPNKRAWPRHTHLVNEEMFFILEGEGTLRLGEEIHGIRAGDLICCPTGKEFARQIINTSSAPLKYLALSTKESPEIALYPDSDKIGVLVESAHGKPGADPELRIFLPQSHKVDYWEGE